MTAPLVGIVMGSDSDWEVMQHASRRLRELGVPHECRVVSAHRTPDLLFRYAEEARGARPALHHRRRGRGGPPARACSRPRPPCPCSACRSPRRSCRVSTPCSRSSRCRRACRSPPSPSAPAGAHNAGLFAVAILALEGPGARRPARRLPRRADRARPRAHAAGLGVILPGATVGMLGGGQLGRMFTLRARAMGYRVVVLDPDPRSPAGQVADRHLRARVHRRARRSTSSPRTCAAITTEFENVPADDARATGADGTSCGRRSRPWRSRRTGSPRRVSSRTRGSPRRAFRAVRDRRGARGRDDRSFACPRCSRPAGSGYDGKGQATGRPTRTRRWRHSSASAACRACWRSG